MDFLTRKNKNAADELRELLGRPDESRDGNDFNPWDAFQLYGGYNSEFDDLAISVLEHVCGEKKLDESERGLAFQMFQEMLCHKDWCDYGTSPRYCFAATPEIKELLAQLLVRWRSYSERHWAKDEG